MCGAIKPEDRLLDVNAGSYEDGPPQLATDSSSDDLATGAKEKDDFYKIQSMLHHTLFRVRTMSAVPPEV